MPDIGCRMSDGGCGDHLRAPRLRSSIFPRSSLAWLLLLAFAAEAQEARKDDLTKLAFVVDVADPESGSIAVTLNVTNNFEDEVKAAIPAWAPGAYRIVKYCKDVKNVRAADPAGKKLEVETLDEQTWSIKTGRAPAFTVSYDLQVEKLRMDKDHCYLAGPDTYFYLVGRKETPCRVRFKLPEGWKVGTGLREEGDEYAGRDYDTFIDCPTELGKFQLFEFDQDAVKYQLVIHANGPVDGAKLTEMCRKIVREQNKLFGGPPFDRYVFLFHFRGGPGGAGLEHLNSTNISMQYLAVKAEPLLAASVTSHEYFHAWNVKRIRPFELGPFDYMKAVPTKALWLCEGVTSYYGDRSLARAGVWGEDRYLRHLAGEIETLQNNPDRKATSVEKASWTVWDRKDWPRVDYYNKGELLGLLMDLKTRAGTRGKKSLDDVMRHLFEKYVAGPSKNGKGPIGVGFPEDGVLRALNDVSGEEWKDFYANYVSGTEELPYAGVFEAAGLSADIATTRSADLGLGVRGTMVMSIPATGAAAAAGVKENDRITAVNGVEVTRANLSQEISKLSPGDEVRLTLSRDGASVETAFKAGAKERVTCKIRRADEPTDLQKKILADWLAKPQDY
jgi:predicted metalloprotease with PDZ domain